MIEGLPQRGATVGSLELPVPPDPMPGWRGLRPLKRWRYIGVYCGEAMLCVGEARVGPLRQSFWALAEPGRPLRERTSIGRGGVRVDGSRAHVRADDVEIDVELEEADGVQSVHPSGRDGYVWTRKQAAVPAHAAVRAGDGRILSLACDAVVDDTAGYHERHTRWQWSAGVGTGTRGERIGWNLVTGVNDSPRDSERTVWIDGEPSEPPPVEFAGDLSRIDFAGGDGALVFSEWSAREDRTNVLLVRSSYRQPFGTFSGSFPGGVQLERGYGVMEVHDVHW